MTTKLTFFAPTPLGLEEALATELRGILGGEVLLERAGVAFSGTLEAGYRVALWSRVASRVLLEIGRFPAPTPEALYDGVQKIDWQQHMRFDQTLSVSFSSTRSEIKHTNFGALKTKDAIVDQFRERLGQRPSVERATPDLSVNVHIREDVAAVSIDLAGPLHRRSWRGRSGPAPLKENLAAGILLLANWPAVLARGGGLVDPMCGAGTLVVEAALMATNTAPGLLRESLLLGHWKGHDRDLAARLLVEAHRLDRRGQEAVVPLVGYDADPAAVDRARRNAHSANLSLQTRFERRELAMVDPVGTEPGILVVNPPYGERLGEQSKMAALHQRLGMTLKQRFGHWTGHIFTGNLDAAKAIGLRSKARHVLYNGAMECRLLSFEILPPKDSVVEAGGDAEMLGNRVRKNLRKLKSWLKKEGATCYRFYDADLPEYAFSVERYGDYLHVQENERPQTVDPLKAESRLHDALVALAEVTGVDRHRIFVKQRGRQRGTSQYEKMGETGAVQVVNEGGLRFQVNLVDYFDTGLFLDHRPMRQRIRTLAAGQDFLNLFAYTGSASVYAAAGGARSTTTIDLSATYLEWARQNMALNGFDGRNHRFEQADVLSWLARARGKYGLIYVDPPTFSNSKSMRRDLDVQRDHVPLLRQVGRLLTPGGTILFSNNFRRFKMDPELHTDFVVEDISKSSIPPDFARNQRIHVAFVLTSKR
jgi:23S rRNA (guanine2445-N2)-methyltransferase / 23S rRNA (guanine2069-N7)-methyltransferase